MINIAFPEWLAPSLVEEGRVPYLPLRQGEYAKAPPGPPLIDLARLRRDNPSVWSDSLEYSALYRDYCMEVTTLPDARVLCGRYVPLYSEVDAFFLDEAGQLVAVFSRTRHREKQGKSTRRMAARDVLSLRGSVLLADMVRSNDLEGLGRHIRRIDLGQFKAEVRYDSHPHLPAGAQLPKDPRDTAVIATSETHPDLVRRFGPEDIKQAAMIRVMQAVNRSLGEGTLLARALAPYAGGRPSMRLLPKNLAAALWLQFVEDVAADKGSNKCLVCGKWFRLDRHEDKVYCSDACRVTASRVRAKARELLEQNVPLTDIAKELDRAIDTLIGLISPKSGSFKVVRRQWKGGSRGAEEKPGQG
jgi:hypothetical protein